MSRNSSFTVEAPAKINLHLEIIGRREDGYHDLRSLFVAVTLADRLSLTLRAPGEGDRLSGLIPEVEDHANTVVRAIELFRRGTGTKFSVAVTLEKRIPLGAGLGGGSSDAAAALRLCNRAAGFPLSNEDLFRLGADIGSDVSFFLKGTCAVVEGRGEIVFPVPCPSNLAIALLVPDFSVSTAEAYRWYDEAPPAASRTGIPREEIVQAFRNTRLTDWDFFNSFSTVLSSRYKLYVMLETRLREAGALFTGISGSGSSCFGVFTDRSTAHIGLSKIEGRFRFAGIVEPLREMPPVQRG